jgi:SAM-dependent methyltransferase
VSLIVGMTKMAKKIRHVLREWIDGLIEKRERRKHMRTDRWMLDPAVPLSTVASHANYMRYLEEIANQDGMRVLEIGSREVTGVSDARKRFARAEYIGFDYYPSPNVDVVGDAHKLSAYFSGQKFDLIYSSACFEHFAMPWVVATEINKLLRVGGTIFVETHFSYSSHERPWHFFQFSDMGLRVLFSPALGFECIEAGMSNPIVGRFSALADEYLRFRPITGLYCHSEFLGRKVREVHDFSWSDLDLRQVVGETEYPEPVQNPAEAHSVR